MIQNSTVVASEDDRAISDGDDSDDIPDADLRLESDSDSDHSDGLIVVATEQDDEDYSSCEDYEF